MCARAIVLSLAGLLLAASAFVPDMARGQSGSAPPSPEGGVSTPIGKVTTAKGVVTIEHVNAVVLQANVAPGGQTKVGDVVYKGDVVSTGADGALGLIFSDGTAFNLSSNARMELNEFVYDPKGTSNSTLFSLSKGTFTFIAGKVAKTGDMKIDTPVATMGIRGTTPHVEISADGTVAFSTLIEDKKAIEKRSASNKRRQTKNGSVPDASTTASTSSSQQAGKKPDTSEMKIDSSFDINVKICRGC
jgi:hypothetical protein